MSAGDEDDDLHGAGQEQAQVCPGRGEGPLQVLHMQGKVFTQRPAQEPSVRHTPREAWAQHEVAAAKIQIAPRLVVFITSPWGGRVRICVKLLQLSIRLEYNKQPKWADSQPSYREKI